MSDRRKRCEDLVELFARAPIKKTFGMSLSRHFAGPRDFFLRCPNLSEVLSPSAW